MDDSEVILTAIAGILVLGIGSQWIAGRLKIPSILLLLAAGILAGPVSGFIVPDKLLGHLVLPIVSLSVGVILFEGAMSLDISHLREIGRPLLSLLTVGVSITGICCGLGAHFILGFDTTRSILLGAILTVTGPTVVGPMLRHIRPIGKVGSLARWEGIVVDPIGAILAVLVFAGGMSIEGAELDDAAVRGTQHNGRGTPQYCPDLCGRSGLRGCRMLRSQGRPNSAHQSDCQRRLSVYRWTLLGGDMHAVTVFIADG